MAIPAFTFPVTGAGRGPRGLPARPLRKFCETPGNLDPEELPSRLLRRGRISAVIQHVRAFGFCRDVPEIEDVCRQFGVAADHRRRGRFGWPERTGRLRRFAGSGGGSRRMPPRCLRSVKVELYARRPTLPTAFARSPTSGFATTMSSWTASTPSAASSMRPSAWRSWIALTSTSSTEVKSLPPIAALSTMVSDAAWPFRRESRLGRPTRCCFRSAQTCAKLVRQAKLRDLEVRRYYHPALHQTTLFGQPGRRFANSSELSERMLCLPVYSDMALAQFDQVLSVLRRLLRTPRHDMRTRLGAGGLRNRTNVAARPASDLGRRWTRQGGRRHRPVMRIHDRGLH